MLLSPLCRVFPAHVLSHPASAISLSHACTWVDVNPPWTKLSLLAPCRLSVKDCWSVPRGSAEHAGGRLGHAPRREASPVGGPQPQARGAGMAGVACRVSTVAKVRGNLSCARILGPLSAVSWNSNPCFRAPWSPKRGLPSPGAYSLRHCSEARHWHVCPPLGGGGKVPHAPGPDVEAP